MEIEVKEVFIMILSISFMANAQSITNGGQVGKTPYSELSLERPSGENDFSNEFDTHFGATLAGVKDMRPVIRSSKLTGVLSQDLFSSGTASHSGDSLAMQETRSALKSGLFSLVIPGAGQAYNHNWLKAAGFFAVEITGWVVNVMWNRKGASETNAFKVYADGTAADAYRDGQYSVYRYAQWIGNNVQQLEQINGTSSQGQAIISQYINSKGNSLLGNQFASPEYQVDWAALNAVENAMGGYFSHWLFAYPGVEYYKEIGKYPQFRQGWDDENPAILDYNSIRNDTPHSAYYENMRGTATGYYNVALAAAGVIIANHFASAVEAAIWAHGHSNPIETSVKISPLPQSMGIQSSINLSIHF